MANVFAQMEAENLLEPQVKAESGGKPDAVSKTGAVGVMQLEPGTAKDLGVKNRRNTFENIEGGEKYMQQMLEKYKDRRTALIAYNWGPGNVDKYGVEKAPAESKRYADSILKGAESREVSSSKESPKEENIFSKMEKETSQPKKTPTKKEEYDVSEYEPKKEEGTFSRLGRLSKEAAAEQITKPTTAISGAFPIGEAALSAGTGMLSSALGGLGGLARTGYGLAKGEGLEKATEAGAKAVESTQRALTYQPRTAGGKLASEMVNAPLSLASEYLGKVGGAVGKAIGGEKGEAAGTTIGEAIPPLVAAALPLKGAIKAGKAPVESLPIAGETYSPLRKLTPQQEERFFRQKELGASPTLASVTREPSQFRFEDLAGKTEAGQELRQTEIANNQALIKSVQDTDLMRKGKSSSQNEFQTGETVLNALKKKADIEWEKVGEKYKKAKESGETKASVNTQPLAKYLSETEPEAVSGAVPALSAIKSKFDALKKSQGALSIDDVENLYQTANRLSKPGDPSSVYMGKVKSIINDMTKNVGGDLYREARKSRLNYGMEFEDRKGIASLIEKKPGSRTDYKTSPEDAFKKTIVNSSFNELNDVVNSLTNVDSKKHPELAKESLQAYRNLQSQVIDFLTDKALSSVVEDETGTRKFSPDKFQKSGLDAIGDKKLELLLGNKAVKRLKDISKTAIEMKTAPGRAIGSGTVLDANTLSNTLKNEAAKHMFSEIPFLRGISEMMSKQKEYRKFSESVQEALTPRRASQEEIRRLSKEEKRINRQYKLQDAVGRSLPAAYAGEEQSQENQR